MHVKYIVYLTFVYITQGTGSCQCVKRGARRSPGGKKSVDEMIDYRQLHASLIPNGRQAQLPQSSSSCPAGKNPQKKFKSRASALGGTLDWDSVHCHLSPSLANWTIHSSTASAGKETDVSIEIDTSANSRTRKSSTRKKSSCLSTLAIHFGWCRIFLLASWEGKGAFAFQEWPCTTA